MDLFSHAEQGRFLRDRGIAKVESINPDWVARARSVAEMLAAQNGEVCADEVRAIFKEEPPHPNAWGSVFRSKHLKWNGRMKASSIPSRHAGTQRIWEWVA